MNDTPPNELTTVYIALLIIVWILLSMQHQRSNDMQHVRDCNQKNIQTIQQ